MSIHFQEASYREKLIEHLFVGEVLRHLWCKGITSAEFLRPEVDNGGYDLVIACNRVVRHVQLKASYAGASTREQKIHLRLAGKPSGCVIWIQFKPDTLELGPFLWFGGTPGAALPDIASLPVAKHTKANAQGVKLERSNVRVLARSRFETLATLDLLIERLFGAIAPPALIND